MRIGGKETSLKPLTVGDLKRFIEHYESTNKKSLDALPIHWLRMVGTEDDDATSYATHVDLDAFDGTEDDPDAENYRAHWSLCLYHDPERWLDRKPPKSGEPLVCLVHGTETCAHDTCPAMEPDLRDWYEFAPPKHEERGCPFDEMLEVTA